ncbi:MAG: 1-acyl-sn-glycerol-3-phosphate acyltransferase [Prevotellaceae bacterium]|jgi:1-acyl-sn-glycerol-3-phosphate acyltransferase|nr:1-acyl-sn-glycerol-3-phosphate acyltransferase [Prevotellaceae bacterium]
MISFENVTKRDWKYELMGQYVRFAHNNVFYNKFYVLHRDRIPKGKPVVAISNHQNGLSDALGILFALYPDGRRPVFIARADIFRKDLWAKLLRFLKIMPAFRARDKWAGGDLDENNAIFNRAARILAKENGIVGLFPEAGHQDCRTLGTFKKGFARIAFQAAEMSNFEKTIYILPMGNHYSNYFSFQAKLIITIGEPFEFSDLYEIYKEFPEKAQKMLADRARPKIEELMLNIKDLEHYEHYEMLRTMYCSDYLKSKKESVTYFPNRLEADKKIVLAVENLQKEKPEQFEELMTDTFKYIRDLEKMHLRDWIFRQKVSFGSTVLRFLFALVLIPAIIFGFVNNFIPFNASTLITRKIKDPMLHSSFHIVMGILFAFPLWYLAIFITALCLTTWWIALIYTALLPISLIIYLHGKVYWKKLYNLIRRFRFIFTGNRYFREATELRKKIINVLNEIVE